MDQNHYPSPRYVYDHAVLAKALSRYQVAMIGSGAWACAAARMIAQNTRGDDPLDEVGWVGGAGGCGQGAGGRGWMHAGCGAACSCPLSILGATRWTR